MPAALFGRHGIDPGEVAPVNEAFAAGDIDHVLDLTPDAVADRMMVAGTPDDWVEWPTRAYAPLWATAIWSKETHAERDHPPLRRCPGIRSRRQHRLVHAVLRATPGHACWGRDPLGGRRARHALHRAERGTGGRGQDHLRRRWARCASRAPRCSAH